MEAVPWTSATMDEIRVELQKVDNVIGFILDATTRRAFDLDKDDSLNLELNTAVRRRMELYGVARRLKEIESGAPCEFPAQAGRNVARLEMFLERPTEWVDKRMKEIAGDIEAVKNRVELKETHGPLYLKKT